MSDPLVVHLEDARKTARTQARWIYGALFAAFALSVTVNESQATSTQQLSRLDALVTTLESIPEDLPLDGVLAAAGQRELWDRLKAFVRSCEQLGEQVDPDKLSVCNAYSGGEFLDLAQLIARDDLPLGGLSVAQAKEVARLLDAQEGELDIAGLREALASSPCAFPEILAEDTLATTITCLRQQDSVTEFEVPTTVPGAAALKLTGAAVSALAPVFFLLVAAQATAAHVSLARQWSLISAGETAPEPLKQLLALDSNTAHAGVSWCALIVPIATALSYACEDHWTIAGCALASLIAGAGVLAGFQTQTSILLAGTE